MEGRLSLVRGLAEAFKAALDIRPSGHKDYGYSLSPPTTSDDNVDLFVSGCWGWISPVTGPPHKAPWPGSEILPVTAGGTVRRSAVTVAMAISS